MLVGKARSLPYSGANALLANIRLLSLGPERLNLITYKLECFSLPFISYLIKYLLARLGAYQSGAPYRSTPMGRLLDLPPNIRLG
jgi:hypothetical protein